MTTMTDLATLERDIVARVAGAPDDQALEAERVAALGRKGAVSDLLKGLGGMTPEERQTMGPALNGLKDRIGEAIAVRRAVLREQELARRLEQERLDPRVVRGGGVAARLASPQRVERQVHRDAVEPREGLAPAVEAVDGLVGPHEGLLRHVLCLRA